MRHVFLVAALLLAPAAAAAPPPPDDDRPLPRISGYTTRSHVDPRLSAAASRVAGLAVEVRCWSMADWDALSRQWEAYSGDSIADAAGYADIAGRRIHIAGDTCDPLLRFVYRGWRPAVGTRGRGAVVQAVETLAHEAVHTSGIRDEARTTCYGLQRLRPLARSLGASQAYANGLAAYAWKRLYAFLPDDYQSPKCRNGGAWDLHPRTAVWP